MSDLFKDYQVEDLSEITDENTTAIIDADGVALRPATIIEERYIVATHIKSGKEREFENISAFKGRTKGDKISDNSWLGDLNLKQVTRGKKPFEMKDFEIEQKQRPKLKFEVCTSNIDSHIQMVNERLGTTKYHCVMGSGNCFRHDILLPERYKSNRNKDLRPLKLKEARYHIECNHPSIIVKDGKLEADDKCTMYGFKGYLDYLKTGKFSFIHSTNDKDAYQTPSLLFDWSKEDGIWKHENPWLIKDTSRDVGCVDLQKSKLKFLGLKAVASQMLMGDSSDWYFPTKLFDMDTRFGDKKIFQLLDPLDNPKDVLQAVVDRYNEWFPDGVEYLAWDGTEVNESALWWMSQMFDCVYMKRSMNDQTTFTKLLESFGVEYENK